MTEVQQIVSDILLFRARIDQMAAGLIKFVKPARSGTSRS